MTLPVAVAAAAEGLVAAAVEALRLADSAPAAVNLDSVPATAVKPVLLTQVPVTRETVMQARLGLSPLVIKVPDPLALDSPAPQPARDSQQPDILEAGPCVVAPFLNADPHCRGATLQHEAVNQQAGEKAIAVMQQNMLLPLTLPPLTLPCLPPLESLESAVTYTSPP